MVTGGAGFIGSELTRQLALSGADVTVFDNLASGKKEYLAKLSAKLVVGDICDKDRVAQCMRDQQIVYHLAALPFIPDSYVNPEEFFRVNVEGSINLIRQAIDSHTVERFIYLSSSEVYGTAQSVPMNEDHPTRPHSTYAVSKLAADRTVFTLYKEHGFPAVIVRLFNSYGPNITQPYIIPEIALQLLEGSRHLTLGNVDSSRDFTFVEDAARAIILSSLSNQAVGVAGSGRDIKIVELARLIAKIIGTEFSLENDPSRLRPYDLDRLVCDSSKAKRLLGWEPKVDIEDGLRRTVDWIRQHRITFKSPFKGCAAWYRRESSPVKP
jgi:dTDP-glucose 4,6-dehydratase